MESPKIRVLFLLPSLGVGGAEKVMSFIACHLDRSRFSAAIVIMYEVSPAIDTSAYGISVINLHVRRTRNAIFRLRYKLREWQADIVISSVIQTNLLLASFRSIFPRATKYIVRESSFPSLRDRKGMAGLYEMLYKNSIPHVDHVIALTKSMQDDLEKNYRVSKEKMSLIENPLMHGLEKGQNERYKEGSLLYLGGLHEHKQVQMLILALDEIPGHIELHIVGDGKERAALETLSNASNKSKSVYFHGFQGGPSAFIEKAHLLVLPSRFEGYGNVLAEANAHGVPCIAFESAGSTKDMIEDGENGFLVRGMDHKNLADSIRKALAYDFNRAAIREKALVRFSPERAIEKYESLFESLLSK